jgi:hypothetical protein
MLGIHLLRARVPPYYHSPDSLIVSSPGAITFMPKASVTLGLIRNRKWFALSSGGIAFKTLTFSFRIDSLSVLGGGSMARFAKT